MLNDFWLLVSAALILIGLLASQGLLLVVGSLAAVVWLAARLWINHGLKRVNHARVIGRRRAFIGDTVDYTITLDNDKMLPLIWADVQDPFPEGLELPGAQLRGTGLEINRQHTINTSLLPYQKASWKYSLRCVQRGYHRIGPARLRSGDIFGFGSNETQFTALDHILVYPQVLNFDRGMFPPEHPLGEIRGRRPLYQDTSRVLGQRDYRSGDPLKHIDWKATAKASALQTKVFEPVVSLNILIAMNGRTAEYVWQGNNRRLFERAVTASASAASLAQRLGFSFGLISNAVASYSGKWICVPVGASTEQLPMVLEALAMSAPYMVAPLSGVLRAESATLPPGATVLVVTAAVTEALAVEIADIRDSGYETFVLFAGDGEAPEQIGGASVVSVSHLLDSASENGWPRDETADRWEPPGAPGDSDSGDSMEAQSANGPFAAE